MKQEKEIIELEAEEVKEDSYVVSLEKITAKEVARLDKFAPRLKALQEKYKDVTITDVNDREGYENSKKAIAELRGIWVGTDDERKEIKAPLIAAGKSIEGKAQWIIESTKAIAARIIERKDWYEAAKESEKQARLELESARLRKRMAILASWGGISDGVDVTIDEYSCSQAMIKSTDDDVYESKILPKFKEQFDAREKIRLAEKVAQDLIEVQKKEESDRIAREALELKIAQDKLKAEQQKAEIEKRKAQVARNAARGKWLQENGFVYSFDTGNHVFGKLSVNRLQVEDMSPDNWAEMVAIMEPEIAKEIAEIEERNVAERVKRDNEVAEKALAKKREEDELKRQREREEIEAGKDSEKWDFFLKKINDIEFPKMTHSRWRKVETEARSLMSQIKNLKPNYK